MSLIGNNYAQNPQTGLCWQSSGRSRHNLTSIVKLLPKVELRQRVWYVADNPADPNNSNIGGLIGSVDSAPFILGASGGTGYIQWPEETVLFVGMPTIRRWRFDGLMIFEVGVKIAINLYKDTVAGGSVDYVGWNRLFNPVTASWDYVTIGKGSGKFLYPLVDLSPLKSIGP